MRYSIPHITNLVLAAAIGAFAFLQANKALSDRFEAATRPDAVVKKRGAKGVYEMEGNSTAWPKADRKNREKLGEWSRERNERDANSFWSGACLTTAAHEGSSSFS